MPSLLRSLLSEHLDPGYAAAAAERDAPARNRPEPVVGWTWQALAALLIAAVFAAAVAQARLDGARCARRPSRCWPTACKSAEAHRPTTLTAPRNALAAQVDDRSGAAGSKATNAASSCWAASTR